MAIPHRIIIVGSGVFGLSTAYYMSLNQKFSNSQIILLDAWNFEPDSRSTSVQNPGAANSDTSRIVRRAYPKGPYAALAYESVERWRTDWGADGRYVEQRLLFSGEGGPLEAPKKMGETVNYVKDAYATGCEMTPGGAGALEIWDSLDKIRSELQATKHENADSGKESSLRGFVSRDCGYANSGATIEWLRQEIIRMGRVDIRVGQVQKLLYSNGRARINGVVLADGTEIHADLTIIAAGCHSARILQLPNMCTVESAYVAYIQLTESEAQELRRRQWPLIVNTHRGVFCVGPDQENCLKLGQCSTGSRVEILKSAHPMDRDEAAKLRSAADSSVQPDWANPGTGWGGKVALTNNGEVVDDDPDVNKALAAFRGFLLELLGPRDDFGSLDVPERHDPLLNSIAVRPFARVRRCWYNDTPSYDFIVDYHPSYGTSLFIASGGCDHAFKFMPVLGEKVVSIILRRLGDVPKISSREGTSLLEELCSLWKFPDHLVGEQERRGAKL
ncbi:fructosyl amino acid oxidase [Fusarium longipes]|uniref:Fructosyl amino acid oxidase n=1 Tax=Fusarium longipes TaxID=694270 RepID=A0A395T4A9_9HYPO|nr:fructosyl amino acid oxidase [Fusarium longipes]